MKNAKLKRRLIIFLIGVIIGILFTMGRQARGETGSDQAGQQNFGETAQTELSQTETETETQSETKKVISDGWHGRRYYKKGKYLTGLKTIGKKKYYFSKNGKLFTGSKKINGKYMVFNKKGQLMTGKKKRIVKPGNGYSYYVDKKGRAVPGWHYLKSIKKVIYARKSGRLAAGEKVDGISFNKKGYCKITNQGRAKILARAFIRKHTKSSWSRTKKFRKCWYYIIANNRYVATNRPKKYFRGNWVYRVAVSMFTDRLRGDCNGVACATAAVAKELGYKPYVIRSTAQHCFVKANGRYYDNMYGATFARKSHWKYTVREKVKF